jgi:hypothetical protein
LDGRFLLNGIKDSAYSNLLGTKDYVIVVVVGIKDSVNLDSLVTVLPQTGDFVRGRVFL